jgi:hypothetical protein
MAERSWHTWARLRATQLRASELLAGESGQVWWALVVLVAVAVVAAGLAAWRINRGWGRSALL